MAKATRRHDRRRRHRRRADRPGRPVAPRPQPHHRRSVPATATTCSSPATPARWRSRSPPSADSVLLTLAVFGIGLILATTAQIRWGLRPLDRVRRGLADLRSGKEDPLRGTVPRRDRAAGQGAERAPRIEPGDHRARPHPGRQSRPCPEDAAQRHHQRGARRQRARSPTRSPSRRRSMRTPDQPLSRPRPHRRPLQRHRRRHRGRAGGRAAGPRHEPHPRGPRPRRCPPTCPTTRCFRGEQQDLEEIVGNLVDNACKWAKSEVTIASAECRRRRRRGAGRLTLRIDDDGPGLTAEEQRSEATRRGRRLDESKPGSGLGLSIVTDLVAPLRRQVPPRPLAGRRRSAPRSSCRRRERRTAEISFPPTLDRERESRSRLHAGPGSAADSRSGADIPTECASQIAAIVAWMVRCSLCFGAVGRRRGMARWQR